jgi:repressor LexA
MQLVDPINVVKVKSVVTHAKALAFIHRFITLNGYPPSIREIGAAVDERSSAQAKVIVDGIVRRGWLRRVPKIPRGIIITPDGMDVLKYIEENDL